MEQIDLLRAIFQDIKPEEYIELRLFHKTGPVKSVFVQDIRKAHEVAENCRDNYNVYFGVAPRRTQGGTKEDVARVTALWADIDEKDFGDGKVGAYTAATSFVLPPSFIVDTGRGYHSYWLLKQNVGPNEAEPVLRELRDAVQGDEVCDAPRVMRVPGTWNVKEEETLPCKLLRSRPDLRYSLSDLSRACHISESAHRRIATADARGFKSRSERDWSVIRELMRVGLSEESIRIIYHEQPIGDKFRDEKAGGDPYLNHTLKRVQEKGEAVPAGFLIQDDCYFVETSKGRKQVSTFVFDPIRLLEGENEDTLLGDIYASGFTWKNVPLSKKAFNRRESLLKQLGVAAWQWLGSDAHVRFLLPFLMDILREKGLPKARAVGALGRHGDYWVSPEGVISRTEVLDSATAPIVYLETGRETPRVTYPLMKEDDYKRSLERIVPLLLLLNSPETLWPILSWFLATPYKPLLEEKGVRFPILNLYGTRGSGKTSTLLHVMQPLLGYYASRAYDCHTTAFVLLSLFSSTNAVPISFSEFRRTGMSQREYSRLRRFILLAYDVGHDSRGRADQTTVDYPLSAPFTLDGEDAISDSAAKERTIIVNMRPENILEGTECWEAYNELVALPIRDFAGDYIRFTLGQSAQAIYSRFHKCYDVTREAFPTPLPDRVRRNIAVCLVGVWSLHAHASRYGIDTPEVTKEFVEINFTPSLEEVVIPALGRTYTLVDEFVEDVINALATPETRATFIAKYDPKENVLWIHLSTSMSWWYAKRRREGRGTLESAAIKSQLRERSYDVLIAKGQYVVGRKAHLIDGATKWMYGVDLEQCVEAGLDIPSRLSSLKKVTIWLKD